MNYPKIGIRPTIDGRWGGVRESLEAQTMNMAKAAKELIEKNVFYLDGTPAQCVIGCTTIGSGAVFYRKRGCLPGGHSLLVLRQRNYGFKPGHHQGSLGL